MGSSQLEIIERIGNDTRAARSEDICNMVLLPLSRDALRTTEIDLWLARENIACCGTCDYS